MKSTFYGAACSLTALMLGAPAVAQSLPDVSLPPQAPGASSGATNGPTTQIDELIVTAEKRSENIGTLPIAISAFSGETLAKRGITDVYGLSQISASVRVPRPGDGLSVVPVIRGIGSFGGFEPAVALVQDGLPYASIRIGGFDLFDVQRVEVLRGPQGTLGGRNATGGGIYVTSVQPTEEFKGYAKATIGNYNRRALEGAVGGPLGGDRLMARLAMQVDRADGWVTNTLTRDEFGGIEKLQLRLSVLARPTDNLDALLTLQSRTDRALPPIVTLGRGRPDVPTSGEANGLPEFNPDTRTFQADQPAERNDRSDQATLRVNWNPGGGMTLTSTTGYLKSNLLYVADGDATTLVDVTWGPRPRKEPYRQWSQEFALTGDLGDRLDYVLGAMYLDYRYQLSGDAGVGSFGIPPGGLFFDNVQTLRSWSGYAQVRYRLTDQLRLTAGSRYTHDTKTSASIYAFAGGPTLTAEGSDKWNAWTPRVSLDWTPIDGLLIYAAAAKGFKSGGFNEFAFPTSAYNPEYVWNYEAGIKLNNRPTGITSSLVVFSMDYQNLQQNIAGLDPGQISFRVVNAAKAKIQGVELNVDASLTKALHVAGGYTYLDTRYIGLASVDPTYRELGVRNLDGNRLVGAPKHQLNIAGAYTIPVTSRDDLVLRAAYSYNGQAYTSIYNNPGIQQDAVGLIDLSASLRRREAGWSLTAFVQNLTNEFYVANAGAGGPIFGGISRSVSLGPPRRFGVDLEYRF